MSKPKQNFQIVIVGGGAGGITVASILQKKFPKLSVALIDPAQSYDYQPAWTLVGAGEFDIKSTRRTIQSVMPANTTWVHESVEGFDPEEQCVVLRSGKKIAYEQLVVAAGLQTNWGQIEGLT